MAPNENATIPPAVELEMQFDDSDPHRRNLVVTCLGFMLYFLAEGQLAEGDHLQLSFVNIEFTRPEVIGGMAIVMLFWFVFRYIQKCPSFTEHFSADLQLSVKRVFHEYHKRINKRDETQFPCPNPNIKYPFFWLGRALSEAQMVPMKANSENEYTMERFQGSAPRIDDHFDKKTIMKLTGRARLRTVFISHTAMDWGMPLVLAILIGYSLIVEGVFLVLNQT